jgi:hypothetical protein
MLRSIDSLKGYRIAANDGDIGHCRDFLFDDRDWAVRYMVADTGGWLATRKVLISPLALLDPDWATQRFPVALSREQIEKSPGLDTHAPVSREYEITYHQYFALPFYWTGAELWGSAPDPRGIVHPSPAEPERPLSDLEVKEGHLRACSEVEDYDIRANDGGTENIRDFIVDDSNWAIRFLVVDTRRWLPGGQVLVPTKQIEWVDWTERQVKCSLDVAQIKDSPPFDPTQPVNAEYERRLYDYYGRPIP